MLRIRSCPETKQASMVELRVAAEDWELDHPIRIAGHEFTSAQVVVVTLRDEELFGRGEASGVYYRGETVARMIEQIEAVRAQIEAGMGTKPLQELLGPGGARNALDCAIWDLEAKRSRKRVHQIIGLRRPRPLLTYVTLSADDPQAMAERARKLGITRAIKLKLLGDPLDADRVRAVREAQPDVWLAVDANQGLCESSFAALQPTLLQCRVDLIEQPLPAGEEHRMDRIKSPIRVAADESAQCATDIARLVGRFQVVTVKLDKAGGLTEALSMIRAARKAGMRVMMGCTRATSLGIAPGYVLGQVCDYVDLDAPLSLRADRQPCASYEHGYVTVPDHVWGFPLPATAAGAG